MSVEGVKDGMPAVPADGRRTADEARDSYPDWFKNKRRGRNLIVSPIVPAAMVGLPVLVIIAIVIYPTIWMFYHAFHDTNMMSLFNRDWQNIGFENFSVVLSSEPVPGQRRAHLVQYLFFGACMQVLMGTALALILYELVKSNTLRIVLLIVMVLPMMLPPSIVGVLWKFLLQADNGAFNQPADQDRPAGARPTAIELARRRSGAVVADHRRCLATGPPCRC